MRIYDQEWHYCHRKDPTTHRYEIQGPLETKMMQQIEPDKRRQQQIIQLDREYYAKK